MRCELRFVGLVLGHLKSQHFELPLRRSGTAPLPPGNRAARVLRIASRPRPQLQGRLAAEDVPAGRFAGAAERLRPRSVLRAWEEANPRGALVQLSVKSPRARHWEAASAPTKASAPAENGVKLITHRMSDNRTCAGLPVCSV